MLEMVATTKEHIEGFTPKIELGVLGLEWKDDLYNKIESETVDCISLMDDKEVICFAGIVYSYRPGVAEAWVLEGMKMKNYAKSLVESLRGMIYFASQNLGIHRMEMAVSTKWKEGAKWARILGFQYEGICRAYDRRMEDHFMFARITWPQEQ